MTEHEATDCEKLLQAIESISDAIEKLVDQLGGDNDVTILDIIKALAKALLNLTQIYEKNCEPSSENGNGENGGS